MRVRAWAVVTLGLTLGLSACSGGSGGSGGPGVPSAPATVSSAPVSSTPESSGPASSSPAASGTTSATPGDLPTLPAAECLSGTYDLVRFVAVGAGSAYGTGQGGDVAVTFADGRYTLTGSGAKPIVVTVGGQTGDLAVDGTAKGRYVLKDDTATFTAGSTSGGARLDDGSGGSTTRLTMNQVNRVLGLSGQGQVVCTTQAMTITLTSVRLELGRA